MPWVAAPQGFPGHSPSPAAAEGALQTARAKSLELPSEGAASSPGTHSPQDDGQRKECSCELSACFECHNFTVFKRRTSPSLRVVGGNLLDHPGGLNAYSILSES